MSRSTPTRFFPLFLLFVLLHGSAPADDAILDDTGALDPGTRRALRSELDLVLQRCDLGVGLAILSDEDAPTASTRAASLRLGLRAEGILPKASTVFAFAAGELAGWDASSAGLRVLPFETFVPAWEGTEDVQPLPARLLRFVQALSANCAGHGTTRPPPGEGADEDDPDGPPPAPFRSGPPTGRFEVYLEVDWDLPGRPDGDFLGISTDGPEFPDRPTVTWFGTAFEGAAFASEPGPEVWDAQEKRIARTRRERRFRIFGAVSADGRTLERLTITWRSLHLREDDRILEHAEWSAALTNVPADASGGPRGTNPLAGPTRPGLSFRIEGTGRETLDHVLEFTRRRGYPDHPETEYTVSHALLKRVSFRFSAS